MKTTMNSNQPTKEASSFESIDGLNTHLPTFILSMLRVAQIVTATEREKRELTAAQINKLMVKHRLKLPRVYTPKQIRQEWEFHRCYLEGGGVKIESTEIRPGNRGPGDYVFDFCRLFTAEEIKEMAKPVPPINAEVAS